MKSKSISKLIERQVTLSDICQSIQYGYTQSASSAPVGPKFLRITDIVSEDLDWEKVPYCKINNSDFEKFRLRDGDIVIARTGVNTGHSHYISNPPKAVFASYLIRISIKKENPLFIAYFLKSKKYQNYITGVMGDKSAQPNANAKTLTQIKFELPSINSQNKIADILFSLDKKISLVKNQNKILEKIIQSIFKSWFIDFDGQTEFVESELGKIPKDWQVRTLEEIAINKTNSIKPSEIDPQTPYIGLQHMPRGSISLSEWEQAEGLMSNKFQFNTNQILFGKLRPYFKKVGIAPIDGVCSTDILVIDCKVPKWIGYVLGILSSDDFINYTDMSSTGTRMPRTDWKVMKNYPIVKPLEEIISRYNILIFDFIKTMRKNIFEIIKLQTIRDSLLPKLMSGEIQV